MKRLFLLFTTALMLSFSVATPVSANNSEASIIAVPDSEPGEVVQIPVNDAEYIRGVNGDLIKITDIQSFSTHEEAEEFRANIKKSVKDIKDVPSILSTDGDVLVSRHTFWTATLDLRLSYTTSGNSNTGKIQHHRAYTSLTGITTPIEYENIRTYSEIRSSGKDVWCQTTGNLILYTFVSGTIEVLREPVNMGDIVYVVR